MRSVFTNEAPVAEVRDGMVHLSMEGDRHPLVVVPVDIVRRFCSDTLFVIDEWEREQAKPKPSNVRPFKRK